MIEMTKPLDDSTPCDSKTTQEELDEATKYINIAGNMPKLIEPDDEFEFECQQCGACCMNRTDIILNPFDVYTIAKHLGISCSDFLLKYTNRILGSNSKIPMVTLKSNKDDGFCPFLEFDYIHDGKFKCSINPAKPGACRSHPIGLVSKSDISDDGDLKCFTTSFIKVDQCEQSKTGKKQKVKDWMQYHTKHESSILKSHKISIMTNSIIDWRQFFFLCGVFTFAAQENKIEPNNELMTHGFSMAGNILIDYAYAQYDTTKPFDEQCDRNYKRLKDKFNELNRVMISRMKKLFLSTCHISIEDAMKKAEKNGLEKTMLDIGTNHCDYKGFYMSDIRYADQEGGDLNG